MEGTASSVESDPNNQLLFLAGGNECHHLLVLAVGLGLGVLLIAHRVTVPSSSVSVAAEHPAEHPHVSKGTPEPEETHFPREGTYTPSFFPFFSASAAPVDPRRLHIRRSDSMRRDALSALRKRDEGKRWTSNGALHLQDSQR
jgi:hypothetical protein